MEANQSILFVLYLHPLSLLRKNRPEQLSLCYLERNKKIKLELQFMSNSNSMYCFHCVVNLMFSAPSTERAE